MNDNHKADTKTYNGRDEVEEARQAVIDSEQGQRQAVLWWYANACARAGIASEDVIADKLEEAYQDALDRHEGGELDEARRRECQRKAQDALRQDNTRTGTPRQTRNMKALRSLQNKHLPAWRNYMKKLLDGDVDMSMLMECGSQSDEGTWQELQRRVLSLVWCNKTGWYFAGRRQDSKCGECWYQAKGGSVPVLDDGEDVGHEAPLFTPNPFYHAGDRSKANVQHVNWVILEMDEPLDPDRLTAPEGTPEWQEQVLNQQAVFWAHVIGTGLLPIGALIYSGGKSIHALVRVNASPAELSSDADENDDIDTCNRLKELCMELHLDEADIGAERMTRTPCALRWYAEEDGRRVDYGEWRKANKAARPQGLVSELQTVLYINDKVRPVSLTELVEGMGKLVEAFAPKYANPWQDAVENGKGLTFTSAHCEAFLDHIGASVQEDVIMRSLRCQGFRRDDDDMEGAVRHVTDAWLDGLGQKLQATEVRAVLADVAKARRINPVTDWLEGLDYGPDEDGTYHDYIGDVCEILGIDAGDTLHRTLVRKWLYQCVALAYNPEIGHGIQYGADGVLTLTGPQGVGKTSFFRTLCPRQEWFQEGKGLDVENKDSMIQLLKGWIMELGELDDTQRREQGRLKAIITASEDEIRRQYRPDAVRTARHISLCATVNGDEFLRDLTGNRRWWTVPVTRIDLQRLTELGEHIDQLWAQVASEIRALQLMAPEAERDKVMAACFRLTADERAELERSNSGFRRSLDWEAEIRATFDFTAPEERWDWARLELVVKAVYEKCSYGRDQYDHATATRIGSTLTGMGIKRKHTKHGRAYLMPPSWDIDPRREPQGCDPMLAREEYADDSHDSDSTADTVPTDTCEATQAQEENPAAQTRQPTEAELVSGPIGRIIRLNAEGIIDNHAMTELLRKREASEGDGDVWKRQRSEMWMLRKTGKTSDQFTPDELCRTFAGLVEDELATLNKDDSSGRIHVQQNYSYRLREICTDRGWSDLNASNSYAQYRKEYTAVKEADAAEGRPDTFI